MSKRETLEQLFEQPLDLPDNDALAAQVMHEVARVGRRRKAMLFGSALAGTGIAASVVAGANVVPGILSGALPAFASAFGRVAGSFSAFIEYEPLAGHFGLWMLAAASLVAMGLAAARFIHEP